MSDLKTELLHEIMMLGADTYNKTHQDRYEAQIKADKLLENYITQRNKANGVTTGEKQCNLPVVVFSEAELKAKLDQQKEEMRQWLEGEGYELLAERL